MIQNSVHPVNDEQLEGAIAVLGTEGKTPSEIESGVAALAENSMVARRLIDWIPEAFGIVLVSHMETKIILPTTFGAKNSNGKWIDFPFDLEPVFGSSLRIAQTMYHNGPKETFANIALRSAMINVVNNALNAGDSIEGATLSGPAMIGIPAEVYLPRRVPFLRNLLMFFGNST